MMTPHDDATRAGLLAAILADPADDAVRLIYADHLDDCGEGARAEFIRVQCQLADLDGELMSKEDCGHPDCPGCVERRALRKRERELWSLQDSANDWLIADPIPQPAHVVIGQDHMASVVTPTSFPIVIFRRGFADEFRGSAEDWLRHADELLAHPIRRVRLTTEPDWWAAGSDGVTLSAGPDGPDDSLFVERECVRAKEGCWWGKSPPVVARILEAEWPGVEFALPAT
jgi:uncharacterized protein (TIGR02996 family)